MAKNERLAHDLIINEGETPALTITARDENAALIATGAIDHIYLRIDDYHGDTALKANTDIGSDANPKTYTLLAAETKIINTQREYEYRIVTVDFVYSTTKHVTMEYVLKVINLHYHSVV